MKAAMEKTKNPDIYSDLSDIRLSSGALNETFTSKKTSYTQQVANSVSSLTLTPIKAEAEAIVKVNGTIVESGQPREAITLNAGVNTITIVVTGADNSTKTYTIEVTRANDALNAEAEKYIRSVMIDKKMNPQTDVTNQIVKLIQGQAADNDIKISYTVEPNFYIDLVKNRLIMKKKNTNKKNETVFVTLIFEKNGMKAVKEVTVTIEPIN